jgi:hypothetical protein
MDIVEKPQNPKGCRGIPPMGTYETVVGVSSGGGTVCLVLWNPRRKVTVGG